MDSMIRDNLSIVKSQAQPSMKLSSGWTYFFSDDGGDRQEPLDAFFQKNGRNKSSVKNR